MKIPAVLVNALPGCLKAMASIIVIGICVGAMPSSFAAIAVNTQLADAGSGDRSDGLDAKPSKTPSESKSPAASPQAPLPKNKATPALWKFEDDDSEIWFLGTFHLLPPELDWRSAPVKRAIARSEELYEEADVDSPESQGAIFRQMMTEGFYPAGDKLSLHLDKDQLNTLKGICEELGVPFKAIDAMRPWNAYLTLTVQLIINKGYDPNAGVDAALELEMVAAGKPVKYFETAEQQLSFFTDLAPEVELKILVSTIMDWEKGERDLDLLYEAWRTGDTSQLDTVMIKTLKETLPEFYDVLLVQRNIAWVEDIEEIIAGSGKTLIAVGAGHFEGADSVITLLRNKGYVIERVLE